MEIYTMTTRPSMPLTPACALTAHGDDYVDQGHDSRTSFHITPEDRQAPPRHIQARALAKGGPEPSSSDLHHLI